MNVENEILTEVEALKASFGDTKALYREVCALLFFRFGITPTTNKLYQYVRKGTMSTPAEALAKFWDDLRSKARIEVDHPDLPPEIRAVAAEAIAGIWRQASEAARSELAAIRVELQADQERARHGQESAEQEAATAQAAAEQLRAELRTAHETANQLRVELEAERRAHAGAVARMQELQAQLEQSRALQQRQQEGFSADLAKAREAVEAADHRAAASDKRALLEIEQERQARGKADKQVEVLRAQLAASEARDRQAALEHAEAVARLQARLEAAMAAEKELLQARQTLGHELSGVREQLLASQQEATRYRAEAQTVQGLVDRLAATASQPKGTRKKAAA
jgi:DNA repair exonuclease SbcCD ATPase subunit